MYSYEPPHMAEQKQDDQLELTYSSYVRTRDVALKTCKKRWTIGKSGEWGSGISVIPARHDDDDKAVMFARVQADKFRSWYVHWLKWSLAENVIRWRYICCCLYFWQAGSKHCNNDWPERGIYRKITFISSYSLRVSWSTD